MPIHTYLITTTDEYSALREKLSINPHKPL